MRSHLRGVPVWVAGCFALLVLASCQRSGNSGEQVRVAQAFDSWKSAILDQQPDKAMAYVPSRVDEYLKTLNAPPAEPAPSEHPGVDLLLRSALEKKVPPDLRANLTLARLFRRITDRRLFNTRDLRQITIGPASVNGDRAGAEVYYGGMLTAVRLGFLRENGSWKIDIMSILPYAETLMRVDRALKRESEEEQVDQLVAKLPSL